MSEVPENTEANSESQELPEDTAELQKTIAELKDVLVNTIGCDKGSVEGNPTLQSLALDSIDLVDIATYAEDEHGISDESLFAGIQDSTIEELAKIINDASSKD